MKNLFEWITLITKLIIVLGLLIVMVGGYVYLLFVSTANDHRLIREYPQCRFSRDIPTCVAIYERGN